MFFNIIEKEEVDYIVFVFDMYKSFRHTKDSSYKAQRKECPDELKPQIEQVYEMVKLM
jgi:5'-3' exonuclease